MNNPNVEVQANKLSAIVLSLQKLNQSVVKANELLEDIVTENHEIEIISEIWEYYDKGAELMLQSERLSEKQNRRL